MNELTHSLESAAQILAELTPATLTPERLALTESELGKYVIPELIRAYQADLPARPDKQEDLDAYRNSMRQHADELNKKTDRLNDELKRIKQVRSTLNLARLDPVIEAARAMIRPVYAFTAGLED